MLPIDKVKSPLTFLYADGKRKGTSKGFYNSIGIHCLKIAVEKCPLYLQSQQKFTTSRFVCSEIGSFLLHVLYQTCKVIGFLAKIQRPLMAVTRL